MEGQTLGRRGCLFYPAPAALRPGTSHIPGRTQTWQWRTGSARCRDHQRNPGGCSRGCAPWTLRGFSGRGQRQQPTESALQGPAPHPPPTHSMAPHCPWQESILFWLMPHSGPPQLTMAFLKYPALSSFLQTHLSFIAVGRRLSLQLLLRKPGRAQKPQLTACLGLGLAFKLPQGRFPPTTIPCHGCDAPDPPGSAHNLAATSIF